VASRVSKKNDPPRTSDEGHDPADVRADDPKRSLERLEELARRILKVPKETLDRLLDAER